MKRPIIAAGILLAAIACGIFLFRKIMLSDHDRPPEAIEDTRTVSVPPSSFNLPVQIETATLSAYLNGKIRGTFLQKTILPRKGEKEKIALALTRHADIVIDSNGKELVCTFPLTLKARLIDSRFGKLLSRQVKPVHASLVVTLSTPVSIDRNWRIVTRFRIRNIGWLNEPLLQIGPFRKNLVLPLTEALRSKEGKLAAMLDREIYRAANLQATISDVWLDLQEPILVSRKPAPVWLRFHCTGIRGELALNRNDITCHTRIDAATLMLTDTTAMAAANPLPAFSRLESGEEKQRYSDINLYAFTSFEEINAQLDGYLRGKTVSKNGYSVTITGIKAYASTKGLSIGVSTEKDLSGYVVTSGKVMFDAPSQTVRVRDFDYSLQTGNVIVRSGDDLLHEIVRDTVSAKLNLRLDTLIGKVPGIISSAIARGKAGNVIDLRVDSLRIGKCDILLDRERIHLLLNVNAKTNLRLKRIKPGKALLIGG